jgi:hypothetical protein
MRCWQDFLKHCLTLQSLLKVTDSKVKYDPELVKEKKHLYLVVESVLNSQSINRDHAIKIFEHSKGNLFYACVFLENSEDGTYFQMNCPHESKVFNSFISEL